MTAEQDPLVDRIYTLRATTREGLVTRARSLALWDLDPPKRATMTAGDALTAAIVRDLIGEAEAADASKPVTL